MANRIPGWPLSGESRRPMRFEGTVARRMRMTIRLAQRLQSPTLELPGRMDRRSRNNLEERFAGSCG